MEEQKDKDYGYKQQTNYNYNSRYNQISYQTLSYQPPPQTSSSPLIGDYLHHHNHQKIMMHQILQLLDKMIGCKLVMERKKNK